MPEIFTVPPNVSTPIPGTDLEVWHDARTTQRVTVLGDGAVDLPRGPTWIVRATSGDEHRLSETTDLYPTPTRLGLSSVPPAFPRVPDDEPWPDGDGDDNPCPDGQVNVLSLFAGIGGLELGLERAGMTVIGQVEKDPFCLRVLAKHWPEVPRHDDVRTTVSWWESQPRPAVHVVAGGYPCQPASQAGLGLGAADERWLWPEMATVVAALRPAWVVWENVPGLLTRGLDIVHRDLTGLGYRHRMGWTSACAVGAPHPRRRLFGVAHAAGQGCGSGRPVNGQRHVAPTPGLGTESSGAAWWASEPDVGRVAYGVPAGVDRRRALGNAVVPAVAEHIGRLIIAADAVQECAA